MLLVINMVWKQTSFYKLERQQNTYGGSPSSLFYRMASKMFNNSSYLNPPIGSINGTHNLDIYFSSIYYACQIKDHVERWA